MGKMIVGTLAFVLLALLPRWAIAAVEDERVALVIGNTNYRHTAPLINPGNDAADVAAQMRRLGFRVLEGRDLTKTAMDDLLRQFAEALPGAGVAVFYYAGHGLQVHGHNYIVPVDAVLDSAASLDFETVRLDLVQRVMERETPTNVLFLDACRNNPLARNLIRAMGTRSIDVRSGLAPVQSGVGTLISFSTQPGNVALDGEGRNSPFTAALTKHLGTPGIDVSTMLIQVRNDVISTTNGQQVPWEHSALRSRLFFASPGPAGAGDAPVAGEIQQAALPAEKPAPPAAPATSAAPSRSGLEGVWALDRSGANCKSPPGSFSIEIKGGVVTGSRDTQGRVLANGEITFKRRSKRSGKMHEFKGKLAGNKGSGKFWSAGGGCSGTFRLAKTD